MTTDADLRYATAEADRTREGRVIRPMGEERRMAEDDGTSLAERLLEAARQAYPLLRWAPDPDRPNVRETKGELLRANAEERARSVVAAVLRELAAAEKTFGVGTLLDLADSIERTEEGRR